MNAERTHLDRFEWDDQLRTILVSATDGTHARQMMIPDVRATDRDKYRTAYQFFAQAILNEATRRAEINTLRTVRERMAHTFALDVELQAQEEANRTAAEVRQRVLEGQRRLATETDRRITQAFQIMGYDLGTPRPPQWDERAEAKAEATLREFLNDRQRNTWDRCRFIVVRGGTTNSVYVIVGKMHTNIYRHEGDKTFRSLCFVPRQGVPLGDVILLQKMALEANETEAILTANDFGTRPDTYDYLKGRWRLRLDDLPADSLPRMSLSRFRDIFRWKRIPRCD